MPKLTAKQIILYILLALPIIFMVIYTIANTSAPKKRKLSAENIKISSPTDTADEITSIIERGDTEAAIAKIEKDLQDANVPSSKGKPLILTAAQTNNYEIASALIAAGADASAAEVSSGRTALMAAAQLNNAEMINLLLVANANPNITDNQGNSPLTIAIDNLNRTAANYLTARGATAGISKENLLNYAFKSNPVGVEIMLSGGADPNYADQNGNDALIVCASKGDVESVRLLLAYKANKNSSNSLGMTPLLYAIKAQKWDVVRELLDSGADVNKINKKWESPLYWAAYIGNTKLVEDLLILGADYKIKTSKGQTALQIAEKNVHPKTVKTIKDFITYKNIPRDSKGNPIIPKNKTQAPKPMQKTAVDEAKYNVKISPVTPKAAAAAQQAPKPASLPPTQTKESEIDELIKSGALSPEQAALLKGAPSAQNAAEPPLPAQAPSSAQKGKRVIGATTINQLQTQSR